MFFELPLWLIALINALIIPVSHLLLSKLALSLPTSLFAKIGTSYLFARQEAFLHEKVFKIKAWKHALPDAAKFMEGAFEKEGLNAKDKEYFRRFAIECRRGELAHLAMMFFIFLSAPLYNPQWAIWVMWAAALLFNLPCYLVQRYNGIRLSRMVRR